MNYNKVIIAGNLCRDVELKYTPKGSAVARITLAINRTYSTEGGEKKEEVSFVDCDAWGKTAETMGSYLAKGSAILVEGRLKTESWEDKTTKEKKSKLKVVVEQFRFAGGKRGEASKTAPAKEAEPAPEGGHGESAEDDVPF